MSQIKTISGRGIPLVGNDIDTDRIIPARFLRCVTFDGLGKEVFADDRAQAQGKHPFDQPQYQGANILVTNGNFGCGSSREHAPQGIMRWGIQAIVGESFAEIFLGNCIANGIPCISAEAEVVKRLQTILEENPQTPMKVDLETMEVSCGHFSGAIKMNGGARQMLLSGTWDSCSQLIEAVAEVRTTAAKLPYLMWS